MHNKNLRMVVILDPYTQYTCGPQIDSVTHSAGAMSENFKMRGSETLCNIRKSAKILEEKRYFWSFLQK